MKRDIEKEYLKAVAKRTRAGTDRYLVAKLYGESGVGGRRRIPDVELVRDEEIEEIGRKRKRGRRNSVAAAVSSGRGKELGDDIQDKSVSSVGDDHDDDVVLISRGGPSCLRKKLGPGLGQETGRKGKGKRAEPDVEVEIVVESCKSKKVDDDVVLIVKSESVGGNDAGYSVESRTGIGSPINLIVDSEETSRSIGCSHDSAEIQSGGIGDETIDISSSEMESETDYGTTDSDYDVNETDVSSSAGTASDSYVEFEEEIFDYGRGREESSGGKNGENASLCGSDDVNIIHETTSQYRPSGCSKSEGVEEGAKSPQNEERILGADLSFKEIRSGVEPDSTRTKGIEEVCLNSPYDAQFSGKKDTSDHMIHGTRGTEKVILSAPNTKGTTDEEGSLMDKESCAKSASTITGFRMNKTKVDCMVLPVSEENLNHSNNESAKCFKQIQKSTENISEATFACDDGTVRIVNSSKMPSKKNSGFVEPAMPKTCPTVSKLNEEPFASDISGAVGCGQAADEAGEQEGHQVMQKGNCKRPYSKKRDRILVKIDALDILFNSLIDKKGAAHKDIDNATDVIQEEKHCEQAPKSSLPQYFTFGVEKPVQTEKSEFEKDLDNLWDEFEFAIKASDIGRPAYQPVNTDKDTVSKANNIFPTLCERGEHKLALHDEIGIRCLLCSYVQIEIKYMTPDLAKLSSRKCDKRASSDDEDLEMLDGMRFDNSGAQESRSYSVGTVWDLIPGVKDKLYNHQQEGFEFIWVNLMGTINLDELRSSNNNGMGGCIISHAPGTGKTRLTIEFLHSYLELFPNSCPLIIAPAGMLLTWEAEFKKWGVGIPFHNLNSHDLSRKEDAQALEIFNASKQSRDTYLLRLRILKLLSWKKQKSILGLSYTLFKNLVRQRFVKGKKSQSNNKQTTDEHAKEIGNFILEHAGLLVLDEGHTPRNPRSKVYKALTNIQTKKRIILSGTPFQNSLAELYTILSFVRPDFVHTISPELKRFFQKRPSMDNICSGRYGSEPDMGKDDCEALLELRSKINPFVHVYKGRVLQESLPGLKDCVIVLNPPHYQKQIVEKIESGQYTNFEFEHILSLGSIHPSLLLHIEKDVSFIDKAVLEACRLDPNEGVKTRFLFEMIRLSEANNEKVLVFSQYLDPLELIKDQICALMHWHEGKEVLQLRGQIEQEQRQTIINVFNDPRSSAKVLLASTKACSEGISLVGASRVVLLDVVWNPSVERQAISRAYRLGQQKVVYSYNLIVGRLEWEKYGAQTSKEHVSNLVLCSNDEPAKCRRVPSEDKILEALSTHSTMEDIFDRIVYHPKDSKFG